MASRLSPVPPHRLHERDDPASRKLNELFHRNHTAHAVLRDPRLLLHNHLPHVLGSSYLLGAPDTQLEEIFAAEKRNLAASDDDRLPDTKITRENWRNFLGRKQYTVAYVDFFDAEVETNGGDWMSVAEDYMFSGPQPMANGFCGGLGHPFIHLAYAIEFDNKEVATEALSLGCTEYDSTHEFLDSPPPDNSTYKSTHLADVLSNIRNDPRFNGYANEPGFVNLLTLFSNYKSEILEHWNAWVVEDPGKQLEDCAHTAALLLVGTSSPDGWFDFFLAHVMTVAHALRIVLPHFSVERQKSLMKQYGLWTIFVYIAQLRPEIEWKETGSLDDGATPSWDEIYKSALSSKWYTDVHFPKMVRGLKAIEEMRRQSDGLYRRAAAKFVSEFNGWGGYGLGVEAIPGGV